MPRTPSYRLHKGSGQALVELNGKRIYLGVHGSPESRERYHALLAEWEANSRQVPQAALHAPARERHSGVTVEDVLADFWQHAQRHYRKADGTETSEVDNFRQAMRPVRKLYASTPAAEFGPRALRNVQQAMIDQGLSRSHINKQISRIKMIFKWAVAHELVPPSQYHGLQAVSGLRRGRTTAKENDPVRPVPEAHIDAIRPFVSSQVEALIDLQLLTGARGGELLIMRLMDIDMSNKVWVYTPSEHKTAHHGHERRIYLGPKAQSIVREFMEDKALDAFLFSPQDAEQRRRAIAHANRATPKSCGNRPGTNRKAEPKRPAGTQYDMASYRRAISRACDKAFPPPPHLARIRVVGGRGKNDLRWETTKEHRERLGESGWEELRQWQQRHRWHPHQLRHNAATNLRREFGIEAARTILGHRSAIITEVYAELDHAKAAEIISKVG